MRARYYNPEIKRFINQDVLIGSITDSPTLNRYAYVEGNPISYADPFGLSPGINWNSAGHTVLGVLGLLTFVPGLNWVGIAANAINAVWYFSEGNIFQGVCSGLSALPGVGGAIGKIGTAGSKLSTVTGMISKGLQITSNVGFVGTGVYTIVKTGYDNYQRYVVEGQDFSWKQTGKDLFNGAFAVLSIYGGAKGLGWDKIEIPKTLKGSAYMEVFCPNPNGRAGCQAHRDVINSIKSDKNYTFDTEYTFQTPSGFKQYRAADVVKIVDGEVDTIYQVGKVSKMGLPVPRESKAIIDIMNSPGYNGAPIYFIPYNSNIGPIIYLPW